MKKKTVEIPQVIYTDQFLRFVAAYANRFKATNGYGRWLAEYKRMDEQGMFKPEKLRELYIKILDGSNTLSYICWDAVRYICIQALDAAKAFALTNSFEIRVITGEIVVNDDDEELTGLSMEEALTICKAMNDEAEELLFRVYNSNTNKLVK
jgi:hypothetical protein|nr:MAG TPA: hypothetical protein [Caudoviricetes sp.]